MTIKQIADDMIGAVRDYVARALQPVEARLATLEARPAPERGEKGEAGLNGNDGKSVTLDEVRAYLDAEVASWALSFERRAQDVLQRSIDRIEKPRDGRDGKDGRDGRDGLGVEDFEATIDGRTITVTVTRGDFRRAHSLRIPAVLDAGVFREGTVYEKGDGVTFGGSFWIAQKDQPQGKPGLSPDWRLAVKAGRDGNRV